MIEQTLLMIKPNATKKRHIGEIITMVEKADFEIEKIRIFIMDQALADQFYEMHRGKPFFERLEQFMCSGKTVAMVVCKDNAVEDMRLLVGDTDPDKQKEGTIRRHYADNITENAVHASDSLDSAHREIALVFPNN